MNELKHQVESPWKSRMLCLNCLHYLRCTLCLLCGSFILNTSILNLHLPFTKFVSSSLTENREECGGGEDLGIKEKSLGQQIAILMIRN